MEENKRVLEETAIVLDYLPNGYPLDKRPNHLKTPIVQALGTTKFILLELVTKKGEALQPNDEIYIGEGKRDKIHHINGRLSPKKLTKTAQAELEFVIKHLVTNDQARFVDFFNKAKPLSTRMHSLELIPGMGKKRMLEILETRDERLFESFEDMKKRCKNIPDPEKAIINRVLSEVSGDEKYKFFVR